MSLIGERALESRYDLAVEFVSPATWRFATLSAFLRWEDGEDVLVFDSADPAARVPWTMTLGHAVATAPATLRLDPSGRPIALLQTDEWAAAARSRMEQTGLPARALEANERLLTPDRLVAAVRRDFPGRPAVGVWEREAQIAGVDVLLRETCSETRRGREARYACEGTLVSRDPTVRLAESTTTTTLVFDRRGLVSLDSSYEATLSLVVRKGEQTGFKPVMGRRLVRRDAG